MASQSLRGWLDTIAARLREAGIEQADADAAWLACHVIGVGRGELEAVAATSGKALDPGVIEALEEITARRVAREPLWHILGHAPFLGLELEVGPGVFSPRPETELLAHTVITELFARQPHNGVVQVVDVGAGSGAIALAIAQAVRHAHVVAVEPSAEARHYLQRNVDRCGDGRVRVVASDAATTHQHVEPSSVDVVVSNPPYLDRDVDWVDIETGNFDPDSALWADDAGLAVMADVVDCAGIILRPSGVLLVEHGTRHNAAVADLMTRGGFGLISHHNDLVGRPRITRATKMAQ